MIYTWVIQIRLLCRGNVIGLITYKLLETIEISNWHGIVGTFKLAQSWLTVLSPQKSEKWKFDFPQTAHRAAHTQHWNNTTVTYTLHTSLTTENKLFKSNLHPNITYNSDSLLNRFCHGLELCFWHASTAEWNISRRVEKNPSEYSSHCI